MLHNMEMSVKGDVLTIRIDLSVQGRPSKNRYNPSEVVASSGGSKNLIGEDGRYRPEKINCSVYRPWPDDSPRGDPL